MAKSFVTITKYWHNPQIYILVSNEAIGLRITLDDFKKAVKKEINKKDIDPLVDQAFAKVIEGIKEESKKAV